MNTAITYRFDKDISINAWIVLFRASDYNQ